MAQRVRKVPTVRDIRTGEDDGPALRVLKKIARDLAKAGLKDRHPVIEANASIRLGEVAPFARWRGRYLRADSWDDDGLPGASQPLDMVVGRWAVRLLQDGLAPGAVLAVAKEKMSAAEVVLMDVHLIEGIKVETPIPMWSNAWLVPSTMVPQSWHRDHTFPGGYALGSLARERNLPSNFPTCALVVRNAPSNALLAEQDPQTPPRLGGTDATLAADIVRALSLHAEEWISRPGWYSAASRSDFVFDTQGVRSSRTEQRPFKEQTIDFAEARKSLARLVFHKQADVLRLAIDRLLRARAEFAYVDKAIDLGIAIEVLLMEDDKKANEQIRHKVELRCGWLLGDGLPSRQDLGRQARDLYDIRSGAVHSAKLPSGKPFVPASVDSLVLAIIRRVLEMGTFPAWRDLTFGGPPPDALEPMVPPLSSEMEWP